MGQTQQPILEQLQAGRTNCSGTPPRPQNRTKRWALSEISPRELVYTHRDDDTQVKIIHRSSDHEFTYAAIRLDYANNRFRLLEGNNLDTTFEGAMGYMIGYEEAGEFY